MRDFKIFNFVLMLTSLASCNNHAASKNIIEPSATTTFDYSKYNAQKFNFRITDGANNYYDSETKMYTRKFVDSIMQVKIDITPEDYETIFNLSKKLNVKSLPIYIRNESDHAILPKFYSYIKFCFEDNCNEITLDSENTVEEFFNENPKHIQEQTKKFTLIYDKIWEIIESKKSYKNIPESDFYYM